MVEGRKTVIHPSFLTHRKILAKVKHVPKGHRRANTLRSFRDYNEPALLKMLFLF